MKLHLRLSVLLIAVMLTAVGAVPSWAKENINIAMVLWRGMTDAERAYQDRLKKSDKYHFQFTVIDAKQDRNKLSEIIQSLEYKKYMVIYAFGTTVADVLKGKFKNTPIVFNAVSRPVEVGLIKSWGHSGNNLTGVSNAVTIERLFTTMRKVLRIDRLGFMYNPREPNAAVQLTEVLLFQDDYNYTLIPIPVEDDKAIPIAVQKAFNEKLDAVLFPADSFIMSRGKIIIPQLNDHHIPTVASLPEMVSDSKAFMGIGPDYKELGRMAAVKTLAILDGKKPDEIPSSRPERFHLLVNITTAKKIGVTIPVQVLHMATVVK